MTLFKQILFPVSLTQISPRVVPYVSSMARTYQARLHLLHVVRSLTLNVSTYISQPSDTDLKRYATDFETKRLEVAKQQLNTFREKYLADIADCDMTANLGTHHKEIINYVKDHKIDLVIMGTGRNIQTNLFGSVADKVAKLSPVPVMLVRAV